MLTPAPAVPTTLFAFLYCLTFHSFPPCGSSSLDDSTLFHRPRLNHQHEAHCKRQLSAIQRNI